MRLILIVACFLIMSCQDSTRPETSAEFKASTIAGVSANVYQITDRSKANGPRILCVVAHPDDECAFAASLYKTTTYLNGACDIVMLTNGEGGYKYSTLAEAVYGRPLTDEEVGRLNLPAIRTKEFNAGCKIMQIRNTYMFMQKDHRYTQDVQEILGDEARIWDIPLIESGLQQLLKIGNYDFVFVHMPVPTTHAHHKAASILALRAVAALPENERPVIMGQRSYNQNVELEEFNGLESYPITTLSPNEPHVFNRMQPFGYKEQLNYKIIVNWVIAEHKSQGTMQMLMHKGDQEWYSLFAINNDAAQAKAAALFSRLAEPQFETKTYE